MTYIKISLTKMAAESNDLKRIDLLRSGGVTSSFTLLQFKPYLEWKLGELIYDQISKNNMTPRLFDECTVCTTQLHTVC